jgi:cytoskeletal protein CcmA (bactofilin family)
MATFFLGSSGFVYDDKNIQGQTASNSVDVSKINIFQKGSNVGINTTNPIFPLDVIGNIKTSTALVINSSTYTDVNLNNTSNTAYWSSNNIANINSNYLPLSGGTLTGNLNFKQNLYVGSSSTDDFIFNIPLNKNFSIYNTGGLALYDINSSNNMTRNYTLTTFNNNVGILTEATNNFALNVNGVFQANSAIINGNITSQSANVNGNITTVSANINGYINGNSLSVSGNITTNSANINGLLYTNRQLSSYISIDKNATSASLANYSPIYPLDVIGSTRNSTGVWLSGSDNRVKNNIIDADLEICYNNIKKLKLRNFQWNDEYTKQNKLEDANVIGFISQEVKPIFPKSIFESNSWGYEDFMDLNTDQIYKSMYGALQLTMKNLETLTQEFNEYKINHV